MVSVLDALRVRMTQRSLNALDTVAAAARASARGERYDIGALETALIQAGMTMEVFEAAVETATKRHAWLGDFEKLANATGKVAKLEATAAAEQSKFEATRAAYLERCAALESQAKTLREIRDRARDARDRLLDPKLVPGTIGQRYREAVAAAEVADNAAAEARRAHRERVEKVQSEEHWIAQLTNEQARMVKPSHIYLKGDRQPTEDSSLRERREALARAQRREAEARSQLAAADDRAAQAHSVVEQLIPEVLAA